MICLYIILTHQRGNFSVQITNFSSNRFDILGGKKKIEKEDYYILELNLNLLCSSDAKKIKKECVLYFICVTAQRRAHYFWVIIISKLCTHLLQIRACLSCVPIYRKFTPFGKWVHNSNMTSNGCTRLKVASVTCILYSTLSIIYYLFDVCVNIIYIYIYIIYISLSLFPKLGCYYSSTLNHFIVTTKQPSKSSHQNPRPTIYCKYFYIFWNQISINIYVLGVIKLLRYEYYLLYLVGS